ncbi:MAG: FKBP-type peptidyl-prolyl cis-trans isomerase [Planctomycetota bacterium]|nr:FKBP-type peptidyl-prolyl cis-trans isomerase [Planctomycetota bacterium]
MKTLCPTTALLLLAVVPGCSREDAHKHLKPASEANRPEAATVPAKPEMVPAGKRRVLELEGGVRVEVLAEGAGELVGAGDEVALSMTLSYVPKPAEAAKADTAKAEGAAQTEAAKGDTADAKAEHAAPAAEKSAGAAKPAEPAKGTKKKSKAKPGADAAHASDAKPKSDADPAHSADPAGATKPVADAAHAPTDPGVEATSEHNAPAAAAEHAATAPAETTPAPTTVADGAAPASPDAPKPAEPKVETAQQAAPADAAAASTPEVGAPAPAPAPPAPAPLAAPLDPVILVSTKSSGAPIRARVGKSGTLLPGLSRALLGLRAGTIVEITLPAEAAYGAAGLPSAGIPPGTPLFATIEIREVKR